ncbi:DoxX family protein [Paenibacillus sp. GCM10023252]|uniref:DoxX family protein n=1 Tax=Paenibacillus sp. GCM10023252 TaxID=3252649 RepID=UPI0036103814
MIILFTILQSFLLVSMGFGGGSKLAGAKSFVDMFEEMKLPQWFRVVTGIVQLAGAVGLVVGYWNAIVAVWAAIWIGVTMLVAVLLHFRVKDPIGKSVPAIIITLIAAALVVVYQAL